MFEIYAHSDAIWSIDESSQTNGVFSGIQIPPAGQKLTQTRIATASADGTVKLWNINTEGIPDQTDGNDVVYHRMQQEFRHSPSIASAIVTDWYKQRQQSIEMNKNKQFELIDSTQDKWEDSDIPTSVIFDPISVANLIVGYVSGDLVRYDIEKGEYNWNQVGVSNQSERIISLAKSLTATHYQIPDTIPLLITTNYGYLHVVDTRQFQTIFSYKANNSQRPNQIPLIAASTNYGQVLMYDLRMADKGQVGTIGEQNQQSQHKQMFSEGITKVAAHPIHPVLVSAGADGIIKVFSSNPP
ncbi:MAG: hypothetical protein EZS28_016830 [Streblomastix strix]|uniref:Uncharacterized protein n=1 Tax=Streblomastix strix TaxID=222440 RepID=A0A5J4VZE8_9EUKA|nr:MAG: hypothetical protein EZS28_016830 [Streblomastix strix]